jgi:phosphoglucomutase
MTAAAFMEFGFTVIWLEAFSHTPLVPFSVKRRRAAGGVMVTASHNPKDDNGYKVYGSNGCQINTPEDEAISAMIKKNLVPRTWAIPDLNDQRPTLMKAYLFELKNMVKATRFPRFVYTPMHGVGLPYMQGALDTIFSTSESSSEKIMSVVPAQATPDPDFPTVKFPNPEEHGALDLAKTFANELDIDLIIANDPDADRLAVAQKVSGKWHQFKGDEVGALLGYYFFQSLQKLDAKQEITMLTSAVSSELLASMGQAEGFQVEETLTGFKWIGNRALQIGDQAVYGYEEALGYMIPSIAHDKDGIAAALTLLGACSLWGKLPFQVMQELYARYGYFDTCEAI